jgi:hypothetical protein
VVDIFFIAFERKTLEMNETRALVFLAFALNFALAYVSPKPFLPAALMILANSIGGCNPKISPTMIK